MRLSSFANISSRPFSFSTLVLSTIIVANTNTCLFFIICVVVKSLVEVTSISWRRRRISPSPCICCIPITHRDIIMMANSPTLAADVDFVAVYWANIRIIVLIFSALDFLFFVHSMWWNEWRQNVCPSKVCRLATSKPLQFNRRRYHSTPLLSPGQISTDLIWSLSKNNLTSLTCSGQKIIVNLHMYNRSWCLFSPEPLDCKHHCWIKQQSRRRWRGRWIIPLQ